MRSLESTMIPYLVIAGCLGLWAFIQLVKWGARTIPHAIVFVTILPILLFGGFCVIAFGMGFLMYDTPQPQRRTIEAQASDERPLPPHKPLNLGKLH
jgi:hypothetical protein